MSLRLRKIVFPSLYLWPLYSSACNRTIIKHLEWSPWPRWQEQKVEIIDLLRMSQLTTAVHDSQANPLRNAWDWSGAAKVALGREWSLQLLYSSNFHRSQLCFSHIGSLGGIHPPWSRTRSPHSRKLIINRSGTKDKHFGHRGFLPFLINLLELLLFLYAYTLNSQRCCES